VFKAVVTHCCSKFEAVNALEINALILKNFSLEPTGDQAHFISLFSRFLENNSEERIFILRGYAGTGKTTLVNAVTKTLPQLKMKSVLLAPTGRAAKVLGKISGKMASTIHRYIYSQEQLGGNQFSFSLAVNRSKDTLFVVDEASMISGKTAYDAGLYQGANVLEDLMSYIYQGENCFLLFLGDVAQLPPVGERVSPALSPKLLYEKFGQRAVMAQLKEVMRQAEGSGILMNATNQRQRLVEGEVQPALEPNFNDVIYLDGYNIEYAFQDAFSGELEDSIVITRSNKSANAINQQIRNRILFREEELEVGDLLMVVKNNYHWLDNKSQAGFVANGDIIEILSLGSIEEYLGFRFLKCDIRMLDYPNQKPFEVILNLNALYANSPALSEQESEKLFQAIASKYNHVRDKKMLFLKLKQDPYFNALQVKFAYAVTCHKAQGGQWKNVFVEHGYVTENHLGTEFMRWIYTALTRATQKLFLINFKQEFIDGEMD
jgi:exodeoxyribonuclease-5